MSYYSETDDQKRRREQYEREVQAWATSINTNSQYIPNPPVRPYDVRVENLSAGTKFWLEDAARKLEEMEKNSQKRRQAEAWNEVAPLIVEAVVKARQKAEQDRIAAEERAKQAEIQRKWNSAVTQFVDLIKRNNLPKFDPKNPHVLPEQYQLEGHTFETILQNAGDRVDKKLRQKVDQWFEGYRRDALSWGVRHGTRPACIDERTYVHECFRQQARDNRFSDFDPKTISTFLPEHVLPEGFNVASLDSAGSRNYQKWTEGYRAKALEYGVSHDVKPACVEQRAYDWAYFGMRVNTNRFPKFDPSTIRSFVPESLIPDGYPFAQLTATQQATYNTWASNYRTQALDWGIHHDVKPACIDQRTYSFAYFNMQLDEKKLPAFSRAYFQYFPNSFIPQGFDTNQLTQEQRRYYAEWDVQFRAQALAWGIQNVECPACVEPNALIRGIATREGGFPSFAPRDARHFKPERVLPRQFTPENLEPDTQEIFTQWAEGYRADALKWGLSKARKPACIDGKVWRQSGGLKKQLVRQAKEVLVATAVVSGVIAGYKANEQTGFLTRIWDQLRGENETPIATELPPASVISDSTSTPVATLTVEGEATLSPPNSATPTVVESTTPTHTPTLTPTLTLTATPTATLSPTALPTEAPSRLETYLTQVMGRRELDRFLQDNPDPQVALRGMLEQWNAVVCVMPNQAGRAVAFQLDPQSGEVVFRSVSPRMVEEARILQYPAGAAHFPDDTFCLTSLQNDLVVARSNP